MPKNFKIHDLVTGKENTPFGRSRREAVQRGRQPPKATREALRKIGDQPSRLLSRFGHYIEKLGPYQSLVALAIPVSVVEPLKLAAVAIAGEGHWIAGTIVIACAYAASLFFVERLFRIVKPKLLMLPWFAWLWKRFVALRAWALEWLCWTRECREGVFSL